MGSTVRVVVQDRRRLMREGLAGLLGAEAGIDVVAVVAKADDVPAALRGNVDVLLTADGDHCHGSAEIVRFADTDSAKALADRLRGVPGGDSIDSPALQASTSRSPLTPREVQVIQGYANGLATAQVAVSLGITRKSVENHKQRIFAKLAVQSQAHAVAVALASGLLSSGNRSAQRRTG